MFKRLKCWWKGCFVQSKIVQGERENKCARCERISTIGDRYEKDPTVFYIDSFENRHETISKIFSIIPAIVIAIVIFLILYVFISWLTSLQVMAVASEDAKCKLIAELNNVEHYYDSTVGCLIKYGEFFESPR